MEERDFLETAEEALHRRAPLAPYWEGRTLDNALETSVLDLRTEAERADLYKNLLALLDRDEPMIVYQALSSLRDAFQQERWTEDDDVPVVRVSMADRLAMILDAIERRLAGNPELLELFCCEFTSVSDETSDLPQIRDWLNGLDTSVRGLLPNSLLAARLFYGAAGETWHEAGVTLLTALDHEDLTVRACAAYQIGRFCRLLASPDPERYDSPRDRESDRRAAAGMAPLEDYWNLIRDKEIARAGVAGAFWWSAPTWTVDADAWILSVLEESGPEPALRYFPCDLGFDAHERFSRNPAAIRRLMTAGQTRIAASAACENVEPMEGMEAILMELGDDVEPEIARGVSWTLAYGYHRLHPNGERLDFVQQHLGPQNSDLFLLFSTEREGSTPYAAVLYPREAQARWTLEEADRIVEIVFPSEVRGEEIPERFQSIGQTWYRRGYVKFTVENHRDGKRHKRVYATRITIGYRSDVPWNPVARGETRGETS